MQSKEIFVVFFFISNVLWSTGYLVCLCKWNTASNDSEILFQCQEEKQLPRGAFKNSRCSESLRPY